MNTHTCMTLKKVYQQDLQTHLHTMYIYICIHMYSHTYMYDFSESVPAEWCSSEPPPHANKVTTRPCSAIIGSGVTAESVVPNPCTLYIIIDSMYDYLLCV